MVASQTEYFLKKNIAPEIISPTGKVSILIIFGMLIAFAVYGIVTMEILFSLDLYVRPDWRIYDYRKIIWDNFPVSLNTITNVRTYEHEKSTGIPIPGVVESYDNYKPISI